ncbi:hypothetical protein B0G76_5754 [Paraburkholderia sp. BL23I1N1]|nr:hypothetical protein B0G76_5754 [Paraburkholderia sp. BL23I1N1]
MRQMSFGECAGKSWLGTWQIVTTMPFFLLSFMAALACTFAFPDILTAAAAPDAGAHEAIRAAPGSSVMNLARVFIGALLSVKIHRTVLLGEGEKPLFPAQRRVVPRYVGLYMLIGVATLLFAIAIMLTGKFVFNLPVASPATLLLSFAVGLFIAVRLSLLFPALSLGSRFALKAAWRDSRKHFWQIGGMMFFVSAPLMVIGIAAALALKPLLEGLHPVQQLMLIAAGQAFLSTLFSVLSAVTLSWLYARFAGELRALVSDQPVGELAP